MWLLTVLLTGQILEVFKMHTERATAQNDLHLRVALLPYGHF